MVKQPLSDISGSRYEYINNMRIQSIAKARGLSSAGTGEHTKMLFHSEAD